MAMSDPYVPAAGGFTNQDYANYMQSQKAIANLLVDKDAVADLLDQHGMYSEEFIDEYIDELYGPGRMNHLREGLKDGLQEMMYQVALEVGTHYGAAGAGWLGARILGWTAKKFSSMWNAWRGSRVVTKALAEGVEASAEQSSRALKGTPGPTPKRSLPKGTQNPSTAWAAQTGRAYDRRFRKFWRQFEGQTISDGIEVAHVNRRLAEGIQPDLVLIDRHKRTICIHDLTSQPNPEHLARGERYVEYFRGKFPDFRIEYTEGYWRGLERVVEAMNSTGIKYYPGDTLP
jgi:hypothetical protein